MPEGPTILALKYKLLPFKNKVVKKAGGYGAMPTKWINGKKLLDIQTWGKHLLLIFKNGTVRLHLGLFGSVLINERRKVNRSFFLEFSKGEINCYVVRAIKIEDPSEVYDWRTDVMSPSFNKAYVKKLLKANGDKNIADLLIDQNIFSGVGNIIRNEVLYRAGIHPLSIVAKIPAAKLSNLINVVVNYSKLFYDNINKNGKNNDFAVYKRDYAADGSEVIMKVLKPSKRKVYFSEHHQVLYE